MPEAWHQLKGDLFSREDIFIQSDICQTTIQETGVSDGQSHTLTRTA